MIEIKLKLQSKRSVKFCIDDSCNSGPFFIFGMARSGSTLLNMICRQLAAANFVSFVDIGGTFFDHNISSEEWFYETSIVSLIHTGNIYGGLRNFPIQFTGSELFYGAKKIFMVRDPRDSLVSQYFSAAYSHPTPKTPDVTSGAYKAIMAERAKALDASIDHYVRLKVAERKQLFLSYTVLLNDPLTLLLKYEDIIFKKREMIEAILRHFEWSCTREQTNAILQKFDIVPKIEERSAFIRRVTPGDYQLKLRPETITHVNDELKDILTNYGYPI